MPVDRSASIRIVGVLVFSLAGTTWGIACSNAESSGKGIDVGGSSGSGGVNSGSGGGSSGSAGSPGSGGYSGNSSPAADDGGGESGSSDSGPDTPFTREASVLPPADGGIASWPQASGPN